MSRINQQAVDLLKGFAKKQHTGPFGQYKIPERPRFKYDPDLRRCVSLIPDIEILGDTSHVIDGSTFVRTDIKYKGCNYCLLSNYISELYEDGKAAVRERDGKTIPAHAVWFDVQFTDRQLGNLKNPQKYEISRLDDELVSMVMEYLAINTRSSSDKKVVRIVFSDDQTISVKNWEVASLYGSNSLDIGDASGLSEAPMILRQDKRSESKASECQDQSRQTLKCFAVQGAV